MAPGGRRSVGNVRPSFTFKRPAKQKVIQKADQSNKRPERGQDDFPKKEQQDPNQDPSQQPRRWSMGKPNSNIPFPAPYWEEKLAKNLDLFSALEKNKVLKEALSEDPGLAEELMRHPDIAQEVARDPNLAAKIIAHPDLIRELALARYEMLSALKHGVPINVRDAPNQPVRVRRKSLDPNPPQLQNLEFPIARQESSSSSEEINASIVSLASRATLPVVSKATMATCVGVFPRSINYLKDCTRIYLRHHLEVTDGMAPCCDQKREYYDILNKYGRILYRAYKTKDKGFCKRHKLVIKEPDGTPLIVMARKFSIRNKHTLAVYCPERTYIGCVEQNWTLGHPLLTLRNENGDPMIFIKVIKRPFLSRFRYDPEFTFEIRTIGDRNIIGKISPEWLDLPPGIFPSKDIYGASFPRELSAKVKVTVVAAWFLLYSLYYNGKLAKVIRHNLSHNERDLINYVFEDSADWRLKYDPSSDSILTFRASG